MALSIADINIRGRPRPRYMAESVSARHQSRACLHDKDIVVAYAKIAEAFIEICWPLRFSEADEG